MRRLNFFVGSNRPWQLIKILKTKLWLRRLTQLTVSKYGTWQVHFFAKCTKKLLLGKFAKCTRKLLLGNLSVVDRIFYGQLRPEDISIVLLFMKIENYWYLLYFS